MIHYPDFDAEQSQALSFIIGCPLAQKAFSDPPFHNYTNIVRHLVETADRLADNCHMPEFTNHALPHICSIVRRASTWGENDGWINRICATEAGYLLVALIIHDFGMLSQDAVDLPDYEKISSRKGMSNLSGWVRGTHVFRLPKLIRRILKEYRENDPSLDQHLDIMIRIATSHSAWPWQEGFLHNKAQAEALGLDAKRLRGLNAVVAVSDLLDEDSSRCDTATLIRHKHGSNTNIAHWIRHSLTSEVKDVANQTVTVRFRRLPDVPDDFNVVYRVLRNHYRLVRLYEEDLDAIGAPIRVVSFEQEPTMDHISDDMRIWTELPDFKYCLVPRLLSTFENEAKYAISEETELYYRLKKIDMEQIELDPYSEFMFPKVPHTDEERALLYTIQKAGVHNDDTARIA